MYDKELDVNKDALINFLCEDAKIVYKDYQTDNTLHRVTLRIENDLVFSFYINKYSDKLVHITKEGFNNETLASSYLRISSKQAKLILDRFSYNESKLELEIKNLIRNKNLYKVISDNKQKE